MDEALSAATEYEEVESLVVCRSAVHGRKGSGKACVAAGSEGTLLQKETAAQKETITELEAQVQAPGVSLPMTRRVHSLQLPA